MLSKKYKIKKTAFFEIISKGKLFHSPHFTLRVLRAKKEEHDNPLFSFIVSSKVARSAVDRNKLKRRGYAIVRKNLKKIQPQQLYAFFLKKGAVQLSFNNMEKEIIFLLKKSSALIV